MPIRTDFLNKMICIAPIQSEKEREEVKPIPRCTKNRY